MPALARKLSAACISLLLSLSIIPLSLADTTADEASVYAFIDDVSERFNTGTLDTFIDVFADDAMLISYGEPDTIGKQAIHELYAMYFELVDMQVSFNTEEATVAGDLAYEQGTYTVVGKDKSSGEIVSTTNGRHIHILQRQSDGSWSTWRLMSFPLTTPIAE